MSNEEILNKRWEKTDKTLRDYLKKFNDLGIEVTDKLVDMFDTLNVTYSNLNKPISNAEKRKLDRNIKEWQKRGLLTGYFAYLIESKNKYTYSDLLEVLIYGIYAEKQAKQYEMSKEVFTTVANDIYGQACKELKRKPKDKINWSFIEDLLWVAIYNKSFKNYLSLLTLTAEQEMNKQILTVLQQNKKLEEGMLSDLVSKQNNRILSINKDKFSGVLSDTCRSLGNKIYIEPFKEEKDLQVRFIAEMDKRTTEMCESMNNMLFFVNDWNEFYRYSDIDGKEVHYKVKGLEEGVNLPPINNHFHWCRSTITYQIEMPREKLNKNLQNDKEKDAINKWLSSDFYNINRKMYSDIPLNKEEKLMVKNLYTALNKQPYYEAEDNEIAIRVLQLDENSIQKIIKEHSINNKYTSKSFESYSLKSGYNKSANVFFYVKGSKKARNMLEYNSMDGEAEILYQYGTSFITKEYEEINGTHHFLLEEYDD